MQNLSLPDPPNPDLPQYRGNSLAWQRAAMDWMGRAKGIIQTAHNDAIRPAGQQFLATAYTTNTVASGTTTGTDLANVVASLVATLTQKGILSPSVTRQGNQ